MTKEDTSLYFFMDLEKGIDRVPRSVGMGNEEQMNNRSIG